MATENGGNMMHARVSRFVTALVMALGLVATTGPSGHADDPPDTTPRTCGLAQVIEGPPRAMQLSVRDGESGLSRSCRRRRTRRTPP